MGYKEVVKKDTARPIFFHKYTDIHTCEVMKWRSSRGLGGAGGARAAHCSFVVSGLPRSPICQEIANVFTGLILPANPEVANFYPDSHGFSTSLPWEICLGKSAKSDY